MPLPIKTYYMLREPKICAARDICIHVIYDSAISALQRIIDHITAITEVELWGIAVDQCGYISTEWLIYSYSRQTNQLQKHGDSGLKREGREPVVKTTPRLPVMDISSHWNDIPSLELSVLY